MLQSCNQVGVSGGVAWSGASSALFFFFDGGYSFALLAAEFRSDSYLVINSNEPSDSGVRTSPLLRNPNNKQSARINIVAGG